MSALILTMVHDFSGEGMSDVYKLSPDKSNVPAVLNNNIGNYQRFVPGCKIMMHVNSSYADFDPTTVNREGVYISPKRFEFKHGGCQLAIILSMFKNAIDINLDFDYVIINHSGELYVKNGAYEYISKHEFGIWHSVDSEVKNEMIEYWDPYRSAMHELKCGNDLFENLFDPYKKQNYCASHLEGSFYSRELFQKIYDWFDSIYNIDDLNEWSFYAEELMIPTVAYHLSETRRPAQPIGAFYIEKGHKTLDDFSYIEKIIRNEQVISWSKDNLPFWAQRLQNAVIDTTNTFSVKRINRILDDPIRQRITNL